LRILRAVVYAAAWLALQSTIAPARAEASPPQRSWAPHHLYVGVEVAGVFGSGPNVIYRYPIDGSTIAKLPDLVYPGQAGPLAVDNAGNLYAGNGAFSLFATYYISVFRPNQTKAFTSYEPPNPGYSAYVTSIALDPRGYLALAYVSYVSSSAPRDVHVAGIRLAGHKPTGDTIIGGGNFNSPGIQGMALDARGQLFASYGSDVQIYSSIEGTTIQPIGSLHGTVFHLPAGLAVTASTLLALDLPVPRKITVSSYRVSARGTVAPERLLRPAGPDDSEYGNGSGTIPLPYQIDVNGPLLYVPFVTVAQNDRYVTGVYEFEKDKSGTVRPLQSLFVMASSPGPTYVVDAAVVGP
jgi:hypothetical protein